MKTRTRTRLTEERARNPINGEEKGEKEEKKLKGKTITRNTPVGIWRLSILQIFGLERKKYEKLPTATVLTS